MRQEIYRWLRDSRSTSLETGYSVQQKATKSRRISGQTWSVEPSCKQLFLSLLRIWWTKVTRSSVQRATSTTASHPRYALLLKVSTLLSRLKYWLLQRWIAWGQVCVVYYVNDDHISFTGLLNRNKNEVSLVMPDVHTTIVQANIQKMPRNWVMGRNKISADVDNLLSLPFTR